MFAKPPPPPAAFLLLPLLPLCLVLRHGPIPADGAGFTFNNGFRGANLTLDGMAAVTPEGVLQLSNATKLKSGHAFYPTPIRLNSTSGSSSFSTTFVFAIRYTQISGHGIVLLLTPTLDFIRTATVGEYLGVFNRTNNGDPANRIFAVELDTILNPELHDVSDNHVGIDANGLVSVNSTPAGYYTDGASGAGFRNLSLSSGERMQVWVDYDGGATRVDVRLAPFKMPKPKTPILSAVVDLSQVLFPNRSIRSGIDDDAVFIGFSASTDPFLTSHYILGWSFAAGRDARAELNLSALPPLPPTDDNRRTSRVLAIWLPMTAAVVVSSAAALLVWYIRRKRRYEELLEEWEREYGPNRFSYRTLFDATKGFRPDQLLGSGGFGSVYKGVLSTTGEEIAVKKISHESRQGIREFVAEIVSIGHVRHRNLVQLLGYCRRKGELLLVYEYMPNGSLDKLLFTSDSVDGKHNHSQRTNHQQSRVDDQEMAVLSWAQRFRIVKGVASGLQYLHEEWEQVVIHRDIKASNVLLDGDLNGRLGDFGLARLYDHGTDPQTTHIVGTMGYLAPELARTSKASKATDVFAFGTFLLEVASGRHPIELSRSADEEVVLADWVLAAWKRGAILDAADPRLGGQYAAEEMELVLTLGLLCSHPIDTARPFMRHVLRFLNGDVPLPEVSSTYLDAVELDLLQVKALGDSVVSYSSSFATGSLIWDGR